MQFDQRSTDKVILDRLEKIQESQTKFAVDLALNTKATGDIEDHLRTLNGKVLTNQNSIAALQSQAVLTSTFIANAEKAKEKKADDRSANMNKLWWLVIGIGVAVGGDILLYLIKSDVLKKIFIN